MPLLQYPSGKLYAKIDKDLHEYFYEDGRLKTVEPYRHRRLHGEVRLYWPNGQLKRSCHFANGIRSGWDRMWDIAGKLMEETHYAPQ